MSLSDPFRPSHLDGVDDRRWICTDVNIPIDIKTVDRAYGKTARGASSPDHIGLATVHA